MKLTTLAVAVLALLSSRAFSQVDGNTVYGNDDRQDLSDVQSQAVLKLADSTIALFAGSAVAVKDGKASLALESYGQRENLCPEEPFRDQLEGAFCSGSLVAPDIIMTAGHCVTSKDDCKTTKFVFGFSIADKGGKTPTSVPAGEVYGCKKLLGRQQLDEGADWALVKLDRKVKNHEPLKLDTAGLIAKGAPLFVIGHPSGLPTKVAGGAKVRELKNGYFVANLDTYGGNSGSAVFNAGTGLVEGILVRGDTDFVQKGNCQVSYRNPDDGGRGEDVTCIANVLARLPHAEEAVARVAPMASGIEAILEREAGASFDGSGGK